MPLVGRWRGRGLAGSVGTRLGITRPYAMGRNATRNRGSQWVVCAGRRVVWCWACWVAEQSMRDKVREKEKKLATRLAIRVGYVHCGCCSDVALEGRVVVVEVPALLVTIAGTF